MYCSYIVFFLISLALFAPWCDALLIPRKNSNSTSASNDGNDSEISKFIRESELPEEQNVPADSVSNGTTTVADEEPTEISGNEKSVDHEIKELIKGESQLSELPSSNPAKGFAPIPTNKSETSPSLNVDATGQKKQWIGPNSAPTYPEAMNGMLPWGNSFQNAGMFVPHMAAPQPQLQPHPQLLPPLMQTLPLTKAPAKNVKSKAKHKSPKRKSKGLSAMDKIMAINVDPDLDFPTTISTDDGELFELFEGDMIRTKKLEMEVSDMKTHKHDNRLSDTINSGQWSNGVVPYKFNAEFSDKGKSIIAIAMKLFQDNTCLNFRPRTDTDANYLEFVNGTGCSSMVGRQGGRQQLSLGEGCLEVGIAVHEIMHSLGFFHEQSRRDRDKYIKINWSNVNRPMWYNFQKYRFGETSSSGAPYDKHSIMHYGNYAFSIDGEKTIVSKSGGSESVGQQDGLSALDLKQINKYYNCKESSNNPPATTSASSSSNATAATPPVDDDSDDNKATEKRPKEKEDKQDKDLKDKHAFCIKISEYCDTDKWVKSNCKKTCCKDGHKFCKYWKEKDYCFTKDNKDWMKKNCPKACDYC